MTTPVKLIVATPPAACGRASVWLVGPADLAEFRAAVELLRREADVMTFANVRSAAVVAEDRRAVPELFVLVQARPGDTNHGEVDLLRRQFPLAGMLALAGSWCEGELRTGRPLPGVLRLYWYEFAAWWRRQTARREQGWCPEWAGLSYGAGSREQGAGSKKSDELFVFSRGLVALAVLSWETADALADVLQSAGYATLWQPPNKMGVLARGVTAGIWEGGQLDEGEAQSLARFCARCARDTAPVVALLDFPRVDGCEIARSLGAAAVVAKPWVNADLLETLRHLVHRDEVAIPERLPLRAA